MVLSHRQVIGENAARIASPDSTLHASVEVKQGDLERLECCP